MSNKGQEAVATIAQAIQILPDSKCEYLLGYAEGVVAALDEKTSASKEQPKKDSA